VLATLTHFSYATKDADGRDVLAMLHCLVGNTHLSGIRGGGKEESRTFQLTDKCKFFLDGVQVGLEALKTKDRLEIEGRPAKVVKAYRKV
jgi:hypothetical protein